MSMDDLLKALLSGGSAESPDETVGAVSLPDLLQGILGGAAAPAQKPAQSAPPQGQSASGIDIGDLLGGILGGGTGSASSGGLGGILGGILGGAGGTAKSGGGTTGASSLLGPIVQALAQKLGLPPAIAQVVVTFALAKLLPGLLGGLTAQTQPAAAAPQRAATPSQSGGFNLDDLLERVASGNPQRLSASYLQSTGLTAELAQQSGLDDDTAVTSLREAFLTLGSQLGSVRTQPAPEAAPPQPKRTQTKTQPKTQPRRKTPAKKKEQTWEV